MTDGPTQGGGTPTQRGSGTGPAGTNDASTTGMPPEASASPTNALPAHPGEALHNVVGAREGMFGVRGSGDTSGYGGLRTTVEMPGGSQAPYGGWCDEVAESLVNGLAEMGIADAIEKVVVHRG